MDLNIQKNIELQKLHTMGLPSRADYFVEWIDEKQLDALLDLIEQYPVYQLIGSGSNSIFLKDFHGLLIHIATKGIHYIREEDDEVYICAQAGENWHDFVQFTLAHNWFGLENLSLIPGTVGAAPVQNIGAYGVEVKDYIHKIHTINLKSREIIEWDRDDCHFSYRHSIFKEISTEDILITAVEFKLSKQFKAQLNYGDLQKQVNALHFKKILTAQMLSDLIGDLRRKKLPDPAILGNSGSFFHNPIVSKTKLQALFMIYPYIPYYPINENEIKLAAAWLIEQAGLKGFQVGGMAIYDKQALVLVNRGNAQAVDLLKLIDTIQNTVYQQFTIQLNVEPLLI